MPCWTVPSGGPVKTALARKKDGESQAIGLVAGRLSIKPILWSMLSATHSTFFLTDGEAHDLVGADHLLPKMQTGKLIADKAFLADKHVLGLWPPPARQQWFHPSQTGPRLAHAIGIRTGPVI